MKCALMYIRDNSRRPIGVYNVVKHSVISRPAQEIHFHRNLGRSTCVEIQRVRLNWAKQLLTESNLPIGKIANDIGFSSLSYLSKVFHPATGVTLAQYRRDRRGA